MALVGPRPVLRSELSEYGKHTDAYLSMRSGLTGMWQVSGAHHKGYPDRVRLDILYFLQVSLWTDLSVLARTLPEVFAAPWPKLRLRLTLEPGPATVGRKYAKPSAQLIGSLNWNYQNQQAF